MKASTILIAAVALSAVAGCRGQTSRETPIFGIRNMFDQPRYDIQEESSFFPDHRTMRPLVEGVVARDQEIDPVVARGRLEDESGYVLEIPKDVVTRSGGMEAMLKHGQARYGIFCAPCHDGSGSGEGLVKKRAVASGAAAFVPPTFHQDRIRQMPDGQLFATISNGKSNMPPYASQIPVDDRWAIVAYVRALQMAQPTMAMAPPAAPTAQPALGPAPGGTVPASDQQGPHEPSTEPTGATGAHAGAAILEAGAPVKPGQPAPPTTRPSTIPIQTPDGGNQPEKKP
jgi:mono/diheme cytochrome c family protein